MIAVNANGGTIVDADGAVAGVALAGLTPSGTEIAATYGALAAAFANVLFAGPTSALATTPTIALPGGGSVTNPIYTDAQALPTLAAQVDFRPDHPSPGPQHHQALWQHLHLGGHHRL